MDFEDGGISLPKKWLSMYEDFVTKNAGAVSQIESSLRSLTYIVPGMNSLDRTIKHPTIHKAKCDLTCLISHLYRSI